MPRWTEAQEKAIYEPSGEGSILVSAAAGSGKTAVLVERITEMVARGEAAIDELLVVTFTEAAAAEMKERITNRLNTEYRRTVKSGDAVKARYLKEQIHLTATADINTIDAFCLNVVKNNFHILGIDPNFSIMDKNETEMLMDDTFSKLFTELYASGDKEVKKRFERLVEIYASNRDDEGLKNVIRKLYNFTRSFSEPMKWLHEKASLYSEDMTESVYINKTTILRDKDDISRRFKKLWGDFKAELTSAANGEDEQSFWGKLWNNVCACVKSVEALSLGQTWEDMYEFYTKYIEKPSYLGSDMRKYPAGIGASEDIWTEYYSRFKELRKSYRDECMRLPTRTRKDFNEYVHASEMKQMIDDIVWLSELFDAHFEERKAERNIKSFSDIEHLAYRLFSENENIRGEYAEKYAEILIDEFQDTNGLQDAIFTSISHDGKNIFMVGDLKQSIYRFRGGDPMIFKEKSSRFAGNNSEGKRIVLSQNFRSRMEVIRSINAVFERMMSDEVGDVDYCGDEMLGRDKENECYTGIGNPGGYFSELYRIAVIEDETAEDEDISKARAEAAQIAQRIRALTDGKYMIHRGNGEYSPIEYRDIVILMKSVKTDGNIIREALESRGIRAFVQKEEYFERREIKLMLSLLSLINNHLQDIPLTAVMRSPIGGFTETELAMIKLNNNSYPFYAAVKDYKAGENPSETEKRLEGKCRRFIGDLRRWREYVKRKSIASLIWTLYEETNIYDFLGALEGGEEAQANLKLLYERAKRYEASGFKGIFNFIRYIERMENRREDISGAKLVNESHNVVRIMTIHKSKGLEFPVVFLARTTKNFSFAHPGDENRITLHKELGIGVDYYNYDDMYVKRLLFHEQIKKANRREYISEEMRLLYVAATRAREKLIVTASYSYKDREEYGKQKQKWLENYTNCSLSADIAKNAHTIADWIIPVVQNGGECWRCEDVEVSSLEYQTEEREAEDIVIENPDEIREAAWRILEFDYQFPESGRIPAKTSVTAIKEMEDEEHIHEDDPVYMVSKPAFMRGENMGARIGTAHHQVMAYINLDKMKTLNENDYEDFVQSEIKRITDEGQVEREIAEDTEITGKLCANVCGFFRSEMGRAVFEARRVYREKPFEIEITAKEYDNSLDEIYSDDKVVVQGIIDLYFEDENGDIILVDYKTDRCKTKEEQEAIGRKYAKQLELYGRAMEKILKRNVKEKYLYLFSVQSMLKLD